jgi:putative isomerase
MLNFDPHHVPFTREGAYLSICLPAHWMPVPHRLHIRYVHGAATKLELFDIEMHSQTGADSSTGTSSALAYTADADPGECRLTTESGVARFAYQRDGSLRVRVEGAVALRLLLSQPGYNDYLMPHPDGCLVNSSNCNWLFAMRPLSGRLEIDARWNGLSSAPGASVVLHPVDGAAEFSLKPFGTAWPAPTAEDNTTFSEVAERSRLDCEKFTAQIHPVEKKFDHLRELAGYGLWSCLVRPGGLLRRPAVLMSKGIMNHCWSWDSHLNAMGLAACGHRDLAWDQVMTILEHQDADGGLPDFIDAHRISWIFTKTPVHGWAINHVLSHFNAAERIDRLRQAYFHIGRWTHWWLDHRRPGSSPLPMYFHGNDGWDNATIFSAGVPLVSPDLASLLVLQMDILAQWAIELGDKANEASAWRAQADELLADLLRNLWRGDRFVAVGPAGETPRTPSETPRTPSETPRTPSEGDCLLNCLPIMLGRRLPEHVRAALVASLADEGRFLTPHGLASESLRSPLYQDDVDSYWRGSIWAPPNLMAIDGLRRAGESALANTIQQRFLETLRRNGFAENFNARTGAPQRDPMYTWTATAFLTMTATP